MEGSRPRRKETPRRGLTRRLRRGLGLVVQWGAHTFLSMAKEKCAKESQRHGDSRGGPPRCALFANIGVPGTAVPGSCICSGLPVANCLRQLCPLGTRSPLGPSFGLREPNGWMPRIYSGHPIPALRPEQSDHVPWADCPQGLSSASVRFAHPPGKRLLIAHFAGGARNVARNEVG